MKQIILSVIMSVMAVGNTNAQTIVRNNYDTPVSEETVQQSQAEVRKNQFYSKFGFVETLLMFKNDKSSMGGGMMVEFGGIYNITPDVPLFYGLNYSGYSKSNHEIYRSGYSVSSTSTSSTGHSFRIPVRIGYRIFNTETIKVTPRFGPYLDWEFIGYSKYNGKKTQYSDIDSYKSVTFGISLGMNVTYNGIGIYGEYAWGLSEKIKDVKQNFWSIGLCYIF